MVTRVLTLGETMGVAVTGPGGPLQLATAARLSTAGAESTVAIGLSRLGVDTAWIGVVGADPLGDRVLRELRAEGVDTSYTRVHPTAPTGFMIRELRTAELTRVFYYRSSSAGSSVSPHDVDAAFDGFAPTLVHLTGITPALSDSAAAAVLRAVQLATEAGSEISLDVNHRSSLPRSGEAAGLVRSLLPQVHVLFVGDDELQFVTDEGRPAEAAAKLAAGGIPEVVVKQGRSGALALVDGELYAVPARSVSVIDVIGAGDCFVAGYLAARAERLTVSERLRWGTITAGFCVGSAGDWEGLPRRTELDRYDAGPATQR
jgi:2-dehydro-3-deoxygluconokinase